MAFLLVCDHGVWALPLGTTTMGRSGSANLTIADPRLSRQHARFIVSEAQLAVEDMGSANGVRINGTAITAATVVQPGQQIVCGPLVVTIERNEASPPLTVVQMSSRGVPTTSIHHDHTHEMRPVEISLKKTRTPLRVVPTAGPLSPELEPTGSQSGLMPTMAQPVAEAALTDTIHRRELPAPQPPRSDSFSSFSSTLQPVSLSDSSLQPLLARPILWERGEHFHARRLMAAAIDIGFATMIAWCGVMVSLIITYVIAARAAGVQIVAGLPILIDGAADGTTNGAAIEPATIGELLSSLWSSSGLSRASDIFAMLLQQSWVPVIGIIAAVMLWALPHIGIIRATVLRGAPFGHVGCDLAILRRSDGMPCSWQRATLRWALLGLTLPLAAVTALLNRRGLHDVLSGTDLTDRRH